MSKPFYPIADRLWSRVTKTDGCWLYTGQRNQDGYGCIGIGPRGAGKWLTHRLAWTLLVGPIPTGMLVLHHCDNPPCVRPDHLWIGTQADNAADMSRKGRARTTPRRGLPRTTWPKPTIQEAQNLRKQGLGARRISAMLGVPQSTVENWLSRWRRVGLSA